MNIVINRYLVIVSMIILTSLAACRSLRQPDEARLPAEPTQLILTEEQNLDSELNQKFETQDEPSQSEDVIEPSLAPPTDTAVISQTSEATPTFIPDPTVTPTFTPSPYPTQAITETNTPTEVPTQTASPQPGMISGQVLFHGEPPSRPVTLILEDQGYRVIREMTVENGEYRFEDLPASAEGYNVLFSQEKNPQFDVLEVVSWAWLGPIAVQDGDLLQLPGMEIGLSGLRAINPSEGAIINASSISAQSPLIFEWSAFPSASYYWVDLRVGPSLQLVWQSEYVNSQAVTFDGILMNGETIQPSSYWWSVGARIDEGLLIVAAPLNSFTLRP
jgi:hypothetical protein